MSYTLGKPRGPYVSARKSEKRRLVSGPVELFDEIEASAAELGIPVREWWRRAAYERLGYSPADVATQRTATKAADVIEANDELATEEQPGRSS